MTNKEETRREFNEEFDSQPSLYHKYNYSLVKKYIKNKRVLDVGCWSGQLVSLEIKSAARVVGIDPGAQAINYAKKTIPKAKFIVGRAQKLPFKKNSFDAVTFCDVIEHLPAGSELLALQEIYRVLKPNGIMLVATPNNHPLSILFDPAYFLVGHRHYSAGNLAGMIRKSGFKVRSIYKKGGIARLISINVDTIFKHIFKKKFKYPSWLNKMLEEELHAEGVAGIYILSQKTQASDQ